jgi:phosphoribosyl 1,2-cyclic phosphate phosphodiesterase
MGVPVAGGFGKQDTGDPRDERFRCSAWVQTDKTSILIDIGPEFRLQTLRSGLQRIDLLLITHEHIDHIGGLDDLRPFNYVQKHSIPVYTTQSCKESIMHRFDYMFEPNKTPGSVNIDIHVPDDTMTFQDCKITPLTVYHGSLKVYGYRINDLTYITDANSIPEKAREQIKGSKMLVLNALRWTPSHPTHFTIPEAVELAQQLDVPQTYLIHMSSHVNHEETNNKLPENIRLAYDQLFVDL